MCKGIMPIYSFFFFLSNVAKLCERLREKCQRCVQLNSEVESGEKTRTASTIVSHDDEES